MKKKLRITKQTQVAYKATYNINGMQHTVVEATKKSLMDTLNGILRRGGTLVELYEETNDFITSMELYEETNDFTTSIE